MSDILFIFFHGAGDNGHHASVIINQIQLAGMEVYTPDAPYRRYSPIGNKHCTTWYDYIPQDELPTGCGLSGTENQEQITEIWEKTKRHILKSPRPFVIIGGFSIGGGMALNCLNRIHEIQDKKVVLGVFSMSGYLCSNSPVYKCPTPKCPVLLMHGMSDTVVDVDWGYDTFKRLENMSVDADFRVWREKEHILVPKMIRYGLHWILYLKKDFEANYTGDDNV